MSQPNKWYKSYSSNFLQRNTYQLRMEYMSSDQADSGKYPRDIASRQFPQDKRNQSDKGWQHHYLPKSNIQLDKLYSFSALADLDSNLLHMEYMYPYLSDFDKYPEDKVLQMFREIDVGSHTECRSYRRDKQYTMQRWDYQ